MPNIVLFGFVKRSTTDDNWITEFTGTKKYVVFFRSEEVISITSWFTISIFLLDTRLSFIAAANSEFFFYAEMVDHIVYLIGLFKYFRKLFSFVNVS